MWSQIMAMLARLEKAEKSNRLMFFFLVVFFRSQKARPNNLAFNF